MKTTIIVNLDGSKSFEVDASLAEIQQLMGSTLMKRTGTEITLAEPKVEKRAYVKKNSTKVGKARRHSDPKQGWTAEDMTFMARLALQLGPNAKGVGNIMATALASRPGNVRKYLTLNRMGHYVYHFLNTGKIPKGLAIKGVEDLRDNGFYGGMLKNATPVAATPAAEVTTPVTNFLGDVRHIPVQSI